LDYSTSAHQLLRWSATQSRAG